MSVIYGILTSNEERLEPSTLSGMGDATARHALDGVFVCTQDGIGMGFQATHTHKRSLIEIQPTSNEFGDMLALDGRIDNHLSLAEELGLPARDVADSQVVLAAFARWGERFFERLHGDWALALWSQSDQALYLARDHAGTRSLYFHEDQGIIRWSTYLDSFFTREHSHGLSMEFVRAYLVGGHTENLTPYSGIEAVPPAHYLRYRKSQWTCVAHWTPLAKDTIQYVSSGQYEEHFLHLFSQAVERRVSDRAHPVIAELSGGMDSSSIVCVADRLTPAGELQTISYYDDAEPNWNERPYFSAVERQRKRTGLHVEISFARRGFDVVPPGFGINFWPGLTGSLAKHRTTVDAMLQGGGYRSILSGLGGDELLGGVPSPLPELADHLVTGHWGRFVSQGLRWSLVNRSPLLWKLRDASVFAAKCYGSRPYDKSKGAPWICSGEQNGAGRRSIELSVWQRLKSRPSMIANWFMWGSLLETLPSNRAYAGARYEYLYPYLDRDLVDFLLRVPPDRLLQPQRRRYLMRRALRGIVPEEILERRRKAYAIRGPLLGLQQSGKSLGDLMRESRLAAMGVIDPVIYSRCLKGIVDGSTTDGWAALVQTAMYELWLRSSEDCDTRHAGVRWPMKQLEISSLVPSR
jgi:asparagine synthase (glutamine-hydrolysing)